MYKVLRKFYDLNEKHAYCVGDIFPHNGVLVNENRIEELKSAKNKIGVPLIEEIPEKPVDKNRQKKKKRIDD